MIDKARAFAYKAHQNQKYGSLPYTTHVDAVVELLKPYGPDAVVVGYLHDVLEDTKTDFKEIESQFGPFIAKCLELLRDDSSKPRQLRKKEAAARLGAVKGREELALIVSAADRLANMQACNAARDIKRLKMYLNEYDAFKAAVYRKDLCDQLWDALARAASEGATY